MGGDRQPVIGSGNSAGLNDWVGRIFEGDFAAGDQPGQHSVEASRGQRAVGNGSHADRATWCSTPTGC
jgi:hypothetical protein